MPEIEKKIIGFEAPAMWWDRLKEIGLPTGTKPSQLVRQAVYEKYIKPEEGNDGNTSATAGNGESQRQSA